MKILFSTYYDLCMLEKGKITDIYSMHGIVYGITWDSSRIYLLRRDKKKEAIETFDKNLKHLGKLENIPQIIGGHQIYYYRNKLYVVNTNKNEINILESGEWQTKILQYRNSINPHINSIWCCGQYLYICEHGSGMSGRIRKMSFNFDIIDDYGWVGIQNHNVYIENDILYTLSSKENYLIMYDLKNKKIIDKKYFEGMYLRGLARTKDEWIFGGNPVVINKRKRPEKDCNILVLNNKFEIIENVKVEKRGCIHDIRVFNKQDLAHNGILI